jgi:transcriptional regulator with XRE-family HTH domain
MLDRVNGVRLGRIGRAIRLKSGLTQAEVGARARVSRSTVSLVERGKWDRLTVRAIEAVLGALGAQLDSRLSWNGPEIDRLLDANHAALSASVKERLQRWGWLVRVEASFSHYGERGRIDLLAWRPKDGLLLVIEIKTDLVDIQALLGGLDVKTRLAPRIAEQTGWHVVHVVPAIVFLEDRTTRRRVGQLIGLFDRYSVRGRQALSWARRPFAGATRVPSGLLWFASLPNARLVRISGQRARRKNARRSG